MVEALRGVLRFEQVEFTHTYDVNVATVICEYHARLHRADLGGSFRRRVHLRHNTARRPDCARTRVRRPAEPHALITDLHPRAQSADPSGRPGVLDQVIGTSTANGRLFFQILGSIAEFEDALMSARTMEGLAAARGPRAHRGAPRT